MNAYVAKGLTLQRKKDNIERGIETVLNEIEKAINKEYMYCTISNTWYGFKYKEVLAHFKELGYLIEEKDTYIVISWDI